MSSWEPFKEEDPPAALSSVLNRLSKNLKLASVDGIERIEQQWPTIVGKKIAQQTMVASLRDGVLVVTTHDPAVREYLEWSRNDVIAAINSVIGTEQVREINVKTKRQGGSKK